jgi:acyl carrier protein
VQWFASRSPVPASFDVQEDNFIQAGLIDSLSVIDLIEDIESTFGMSFDEAAFQDRRFVSMGGLADILAERSAMSGVHRQLRGEG